MVSLVDTLARANLVLPLAGHNFGVDTRDGHASEQAGAVVSLNDVATENLIGANTAIVGALGTGETARGPAEWGLAVGLEESVLLLDAEPGVLIGVGVHDLLGVGAVVSLVWGTVGVVSLAEDEDVVALAEGVGEDGDGLEEDVRVVAGGLLGRGAVEVPLGKIGGGRGLGAQGLRLATELITTVDPDVLGLDKALLVEIKVLAKGGSNSGGGGSHD
ncbi:hypothetical protein BC936DRAFT_149102 [Jimgerdemannia flammicorona]|uniref:Uncharacterized protein n=2 Tax=Jimgerdemannia flammicorona TaxID=994334 RepID=A0A433QEU2_9FUNG|nr:hypothetical protein BC936DRAFT_149102 [Jimgerdemannia flammicorona]RUS28297.1 hypothetical protein BC938DRAFT_482049 [Jimgerdemannia flammicorona]